MSLWRLFMDSVRQLPSPEANACRAAFAEQPQAAAETDAHPRPALHRTRMCRRMERHAKAISEHVRG
jgi:hypothetical protein